MGFLARLGAGFALSGAVKWLMAAGIAAMVAGAVYGLIEYGAFLRGSKVDRLIMEDVKKNRELNYKVDRATIDNDAALTLKLQEIDRTWLSDQSSP